MASECKACIWRFARSFVVIISRNNIPNKITFLDFRHGNGCPKQLFAFQLYSLWPIICNWWDGFNCKCEYRLHGVIVSGLFLFTEPATWNRVVGVIIGVTGVAIAIGFTPTLPKADANDLFLRSLAIIIATIAYAFAGVWGKIKLAGYSSTQSAAGMLIGSSAVSVLCSFFISGPPSLAILDYPFDLIKIVLGLGVLGTALAYPLYFKILEVAGSSNLMLVTIIVPVIAIILDALMLNQFVTGSDLFGFALVATGLLIMDGRLNNYFIKKN